MPVNKEAYEQLKQEVAAKGATLIAVSKTKPVEDILELYQLGQRHFGENYVQELLEKKDRLPADISWHFIGHLQSNKAKFIVPFVHLIHGIDSYKLLMEVNKQALKAGKVAAVLLQVHIAQEETKFGFDEVELKAIYEEGIAPPLAQLSSVTIQGFMGMASFSGDVALVRQEFQQLKTLYSKYAEVPRANSKLQTLSMGMSGDYKLALEQGSTMVRIGSLLFGART